MALRYVALGSSFAAGPGLDPVVDKPTGRSAVNYPHLVAGELGLDLVDATCSGATTSDLNVTSQRLAWRRHVPPQLASIGPTTDLVTITAGGNDVGYIGALVSTTRRQVTLTRLSRLPDRITRPFRPSIDALPTPDDARAVAHALTDVVLAVRARAPSARVLLVQYLTVLGSAPTGLPLTDRQEEQLRGVAAGLAEAFAVAAGRADADLVPVAGASAAHGVGSPDPWVTGIGRGIAAPFHPTARGMAAVADLVLASLRG